MKRTLCALGLLVSTGCAPGVDIEASEAKIQALRHERGEIERIVMKYRNASGTANAAKRQQAAIDEANELESTIVGDFDAMGIPRKLDFDAVARTTFAIDEKIARLERDIKEERAYRGLPAPTATSPKPTSLLARADAEGAKGNFQKAIDYLENIDAASSERGQAQKKLEVYRRKVAEASKVATQAKIEAVRAEVRATHPEKLVEVVPATVTWERRGGWSYIRGSVKNDSGRAIRYWKVTAEFLSERGEIVDSGIDNSAELLKPGASVRFEIMRQEPPGARSVRAKVTECDLAN